MNWLNRRPLLVYFILVFAAEWLLFLALSPFLPPMAALLIGSWLPNAVGLLVTHAAEGKPGLRQMWARIVNWDFNHRWVVVALLLPALMAGLAIGLHRLLGRQPPVFAPLDQWILILLASISTGALGEELGWRGTALPRLQDRFTPLNASLILGLLWGLYHLPAFFLSGSPQEGIPIIPFMFGAVELTFLITWAFNRASGSLIPVFLFHFAFNFTLSITGLPADPSLFWLFALATGVLTLAVVVTDWERFTRPPSSTSGPVERPE